MRLWEIRGSCDTTHKTFVSDARTEDSGVDRWPKMREFFGRKVGDLSDAGNWKTEKLKSGETGEAS